MLAGAARTGGPPLRHSLICPSSTMEYVYRSCRLEVNGIPPRGTRRPLSPDIAFEPQRTPVPTASPLVRRESPGISEIRWPFAVFARFAVKYLG